MNDAGKYTAVTTAVLAQAFVSRGKIKTSKRAGGEQCQAPRALAGALSGYRPCSPASLTAHYTCLPKISKPREDGPPALGSTEHVAEGPSEGCRTRFPPFPFAFVGLFGAFRWACAGPEAGSCLPCLIRCER